MCIYLNIYIFLLSCESLRAFFARQIQVLSCTSRLQNEGLTAVFVSEMSWLVLTTVVFQFFFI